MRQKYVISRDLKKRELNIREYAVTDKNMNKVASPLLRNGNYALLCEETYESDRIVRSIAEGTDALVASLRTPNLYPIAPYARKIAESVTALYDSSEDDSVELFFDDVDLVSA